MLPTFRSAVFAITVMPVIASCKQPVEPVGPAPGMTQSMQPSGPGSPPQDPVASPQDRHAAFDQILAAHVRNERIDYLAIRDQQFKKLEGYLDALARLDVAKLSRDEQLALLINLYNATMIHTVIQRYTPAWNPSVDKFAVFDEKLVRIGGKRISLNELEHQRIRKDFKEPRIHAALVCAARSCPPLLPRAYRAADLEKTLEQKMRRFVLDESRNRIGTDRVQLSKLFEWYADDFGKNKAQILGYVSRYAGEDVSEFDIGYLDYSWATNIAAPEGEWVTSSGLDPSIRKMPVKVLSRTGDKVKVRLPFGRGEAEVSSSSATAVRFEG